MMPAVQARQEFTPTTLADQTLTAESFGKLLHWAYNNTVSDLLLCSDKPVWVSHQGNYLAISRRPLMTWELSDLLEQIYIKSASARLCGGQDMDFIYEYKADRKCRLRFRINAVSVAAREMNTRGLALSIRVVNDVPPTVQELAVPAAILQMISHLQQGLILVCGATGSGKSTLLASLMAFTLRLPTGRSIVSYEAPIEFNLSRLEDTRGVIVQSEIPRDLPDFTTAVRNALRRNPDIILIGEARDRETISELVRAAQTGHLVYSTLHTTTVSASLARMADEYPPELHHMISIKLLDSIRLIICQQLLQAIRQGRMALREYLLFTPEVRQRLLTEFSAGKNLQLLLKDCMHHHGHSFYQDAKEHYRHATIDSETFHHLHAEYCDDQ